MAWKRAWLQIMGSKVMGMLSHTPWMWPMLQGMLTLHENVLTRAWTHTQTLMHTHTQNT